MTLHNPPLHSLYDLRVCKCLFGPCTTHIPLLSYTLPCSSYALKVIRMTAGQQPQLSEKECKWPMHLHSSHYFPIQRNVTVSPATFTLPRPATTSTVFLKQVSGACSIALDPSLLFLSLILATCPCTIYCPFVSPIALYRRLQVHHPHKHHWQHLGFIDNSCNI